MIYLFSKLKCTWNLSESNWKKATRKTEPIQCGVFREMHSCMWNLVFINSAFGKTKFMFEYLLSNRRSIKEYSIWSNAQTLWKRTSKQIVVKVFFKGIFQKITVMLVGCLFKWTNVHMYKIPAINAHGRTSKMLAKQRDRNPNASNCIKVMRRDKRK